MKKQFTFIICALLAALPVAANNQISTNNDFTDCMNNDCTLKTNISCPLGNGNSSVLDSLSDLLNKSNYKLPDCIGDKLCGSDLLNDLICQNNVFNNWCGEDSDKEDNTPIIPEWSPEKPEATPDEKPGERPDASPEQKPDTSPEQKPETDEQKPQTPEGENSGNFSEYVKEVAELVNMYRQQNGLGKLTLDAKLSQVAQIRAVETVTLFSHTRPNGKDCFSVLDENGVSYSGAGENIAMGQPTPESVVDAWMNSQGHRENILNPNFTKIGVGCHTVGSTIYWSQMFTY